MRENYDIKNLNPRKKPYINAASQPMDAFMLKCSDKGGFHMKLACELAVMDMDGEITAVAVGEDSAKFHGMLRLNEEAADIINLLTISGGMTFPNLVASLQTKYTESSREEIAKFAEEFLKQLWQEGLLVE